MPVYSLSITTAHGRQATTLSDFPNDRTVIADTGRFVSPEHPCVALAKDVGGGVHFIGAWDWEAGAARWTSEKLAEGT